jgi:Domain of Unknown Function (DUF1206)
VTGTWFPDIASGNRGTAVPASSSLTHRLAHPFGGTGTASAGRRGGGSNTPSRSQTADWLGTVGWTAKGVIYLLIAVIAIQLALSGGAEDDQASKQGALQALVDKPFGSVMLTVVVIGLFAYALYRLLAVFLPQPATGSGNKEEAKEKGHQLIHLGSAVAYGAFGVQGVSVLLGRSSGGGGEATQKSWSATLLSSTPGTVLLLAVGIGFLAFAAWQVKKAVTRSFLEKLECPAGSFPNRGTVESVGVTGLLARGVVAAMIGVFVAVSVWRHDPNEVRGLDGSLRALQGAPFGPPLLVVVALGLAAYGAFSLVSARCRRHELG